MRGHGWPKLALATLLALVSIPGVAHAATLTAVSIFGDPADAITDRQPRLFTPPTATISAFVGEQSAGVTVVDAQGRRWQLGFFAPEGRPLTPGSYPDASPTQLRAPGRAAIALSGPGSSCLAATGDFEIKDVAPAPDGTASRLSAIYDARCDGAPGRIFGEVRVGEPRPAGPLAALPTRLRFPGVPAGARTAVVPIAVIASRATRLRGVALVGRDAAAWRIVRNGCRRRVLARGATCQVWASFG